MRQKTVITKLLQSVTKFLTKCVRYYKVHQVLQSVTVITKPDATLLNTFYSRWWEHRLSLRRVKEPILVYIWKHGYMMQLKRPLTCIYHQNFLCRMKITQCKATKVIKIWMYISQSTKLERHEWFRKIKGNIGK